jgi:hypothetical protein
MLSHLLSYIIEMLVPVRYSNQQTLTCKLPFEITLLNSSLALRSLPLFTVHSLPIIIAACPSETLRQRCLPPCLPACVQYMPAWNLPSPVTSGAEALRVVAIFMPAAQRFVVASSAVPSFGLLHVGIFCPESSVVCAISTWRKA